MVGPMNSTFFGEEEEEEGGEEGEEGIGMGKGWRGGERLPGELEVCIDGNNKQRSIIPKYAAFLWIIK